MKRILYYSRMTLLYLCPLIFIANASAQTKQSTIKGTVTTSDGNPAASVNISLIELNRKTSSEGDGTFVLKSITPGTYILKISSIGLESLEKRVTIEQDQTIDVHFILTESSSKLKEVFIIGGSQNHKAISIGKTNIDPIDMPQSISIISSQTISDQQANRLSDVIKNVNGVALGTSRGSTAENFVSRGYSLGSNNYFKNGSRYNSGAIPEVSTLEQVEVLKGSSAMLFGNVSGGAIVNLVTKKPQFENGGEISMRSGSHSSYKPTADIYGPISKKLAFRLIGTYENNHSYRNEVKSEKYYFNPSFLYKIDEKTDLLVQGDYLNYDLTPDFGIGSLDGKIPTMINRSAFFNTPWAFNKANQTTASATLDRQISNSWKLNFIGSFQQFNRDYYSTERIQADAIGDWSRVLNRTNTSEDYFTAQVNLSGKLKTGTIEHSILIGTDGDQYMNTGHTFSFNTAYDKINLLDPLKYSARTDIPEALDSLQTKTPTYRLGYYIQDLVSVSEHLKVMAGLRWSYQKALTADIYNLITDVKSKATAAPKSDQAFSPRVGVVYQPVQTTALFASYSNNFTVNSGIGVNDQALSPSIVDQFEVGIKNDFLKGRLSANLSVYRIINNNLAQQAQFLKDGITVNTNTSIKELTGQTTSDGVEIDIKGTILPGLSFMGGYSYNFMRYTKTSGRKGSYIEGERLVSNPAQTANASFFYTFNNSTLRGLKVGSSAYYIGKRNAGWNNTHEQAQAGSRLISLDGFSTFDLTLGYSNNKFSILAKVSNLTNELNYYVHENYSVNPIAPRQFQTTLSYRF